MSGRRVPGQRRTQGRTCCRTGSPLRTLNSASVTSPGWPKGYDPLGGLAPSHISHSIAGRCLACGIARPPRMSLARRSLIPTASATLRTPMARNFGNVIRLPPIVVVVDGQPFVQLVSIVSRPVNRSSSRFDSLPVSLISPATTGRRWSRPTVPRPHRLPSGPIDFTSG
jgi:hypothetical protein